MCLASPKDEHVIPRLSERAEGPLTKSGRYVLGVDCDRPWVRSLSVLRPIGMTGCARGDTKIHRFEWDANRQIK